MGGSYGQNIEKTTGKRLIKTIHIGKAAGVGGLAHQTFSKMAYLKKDEIIFAQKPRPDYSGIPEREEVKPKNTTKHVFIGQTPHNKMVYDLQIAAEARNREIIEQMEAEAKKEGKTIIWYCCEFARDILEGAIAQGIRPDDFWSVFVDSFVGKENYSELKSNLGIKEPDNHRYSGYNCKGNSLIMFIRLSDDEPSFEEMLKKGVNHHLKRLENKSISLYYLESLMNDIQNSKKIPAFGGRDKYNREIQPLNLWLKKKADKIRAKLTQGNGKYQLTLAEIEGLEKKGLDREDINHADQVISTYENWLDPNYETPNFSRGIDYYYRLENGDYSPKKGEGCLTLFILPEIEWQKIEQRKGEILEGYVKDYTKALTDFFNAKYRCSKDRNRLIQQEIQRINSLLYQNEKKVTYEVITESLVLHLYTFPGVQGGSMYYHFDEVIVKGLNGREPSDYVRPYHNDKGAIDLFTLNDGLHFVVAAFACERFKSYLSALTKGNKPLPNAETTQPEKVIVDFNSLFISPESMEQALVAAEKVEMIRRNGEVIVWSRKWKAGAIVFFWEHLKTMNPPMVDILIDYRVAADVIAEKFGTTISDRTKRATPNYRGDFLKAIKAVL